MRTLPRGLFRSILLFSFVTFALGPAATNVSAGSLIGSFSGVVEGAPVGTTLPGTVKQNEALSGGFSYNSAAATESGASGIYTFTNTSAQALSFSVSAAGFGDAYVYNAPAAAFQITVGAISGVETLTIHAVTEYQQTAGPPAVYAFINLVFTSSIYKGTALPSTTTALEEFKLTAGQLTWDPGPNGLNGSAGVNTLNGQEIVPEPSSLALAIIAIAIGSAGFLNSRRKRRTGP